MDSVPKRMITEENLDLISNLPDCVLAYILSKLPTKFAVGTAILSTRWKRLFSLIPDPELHLDDTVLLHSQNINNPTSIFADFAHRVLKVLLEEVPYIHKLTLKCTRKYDDEKVVDWLYAALYRDVLELDITVAMDEPEMLFELLSDWKSLVTLTLRSHTHMHMCISSAFSMPSVRWLTLYGIKFVDEEEIPMALAGCPVLEFLTMSYCRLRGIVDLNVSSQSLKHLTFEYCLYNELYSIDYFELDTPALEEFCFKDYVPSEFVCGNLNSLRTANVSILQMEGLDEANTLEYEQQAGEFIKAFSNVETLHLSKDSMSALEKSGEHLPVFCNLKSLHLGCIDTSYWNLLPQLLENAPKLEHLRILEGLYEESGSKMFQSRLVEKTPTCVLSTLKKFEIFNFEGEIDEMFLIVYFLVRGKVLNKLEIMANSPSQILVRFRELLDSMPNLSETCEVLYFTPKN